MFPDHAKAVHAALRGPKQLEWTDGNQIDFYDQEKPVTEAVSLAVSHFRVDYRLPDGFSWSELTSILSVVVASRRAVGLEVTIYNPLLDDDGTAGRELTDVLVAGLGTSAPWSTRD